MLSLPESWELPLHGFKALLGNTTRSEGTDPLCCHWVRTKEWPSWTGMTTLFQRVKQWLQWQWPWSTSGFAHPAVDPTIFHICFRMRARCSQEMFPPLERKWRHTAKAMAGCDTQEQQQDALRTGAGGQGALCHLSTPDKTTDSIMFWRMEKHLWWLYLETLCAWMWGRQVVLAFSRPGSSPSPAHHPCENSKEFPWITPSSDRAAETPINGKKTPTKHVQTATSSAHTQRGPSGDGSRQCCQLNRCDWWSRRQGLNPPR